MTDAPSGRGRIYRAMHGRPTTDEQASRDEIDMACLVLSLQLRHMYPPDMPGWKRQTLPKNTPEKIAAAAQRIAHGRPSGVDVAAIASLPALMLQKLGCTGADFIVMAGGFSAYMASPIVPSIPSIPPALPDVQPTRTA
jgi:hypothetical protein